MWGFVWRTQQVAWNKPERESLPCLPITHSDLFVFHLLALIKQPPMCAQSPTHQNTLLFSGILEDLKWLSILCCNCASGILSQYRLWDWTLGIPIGNINSQSILRPPHLAWQGMSWTLYEFKLCISGPLGMIQDHSATHTERINKTIDHN